MDLGGSLITTFVAELFVNEGNIIAKGKVMENLESIL